MQGVIVGNLQNEVFEDIVTRMTYNANNITNNRLVSSVNKFDTILLYIYSYALMIIGVIYFVVAVY
jgi:hypothetical protein